MKSIFKAVALITFFTVISRFLGFLFKIYLSREIGAEALGVFQVAFSIFMVLVTCVATGLPLIISKLSSSLHAKGNHKEEASMVSTALIVSLILALITCLVVFLFNNVFKLIFTDDRCVLILILLLPAVVFNAIYATFRGWFWGRSNYLAVCLAELFEQVARIIIFVLMIGGTLSVLDGAVTSAVSLTIACFLSAVLITVLFFVYGGRLKKPKGFAKEIIKSSTPITFVRVASSLIQPIIAIIIPLRLVASGVESADAMALFGVAFGMTLPFLYIPSALIGSISMALVPDLSTAVAQNNKNHIENRITTSIVVSLFISCLFVPIYMGAGENIGIFFFDNLECGKMLVWSAWIMVPIGLTNITSSILNTLGYEVKSMKNYILGGLIMLASIWFLPTYIGIYSVVVGMGLCMLVSCFLNLKMINKITTSKVKILRPVTLISVCSLPVAGLVSFCSGILGHFIPLIFNLTISCGIGVVAFLLVCHSFDLVDIKYWFINFKGKFNKKKKGLQKT